MGCMRCRLPRLRRLEKHPGTWNLEDVPKSNSKLPFLFGFPHTGEPLPQGLKGRLQRAPGVLRALSDTGLTLITELPVEEKVECPVHSFACDVTKDPAHPSAGGVVPTQDWDGEPLYTLGDEPNEVEIAALIETYHAPFHASLQTARKNEDVLFHFQMRCFEATPPKLASDYPQFSADPTYTRPEVMLGNRGGPDAGPLDGGYTSCTQVDLVQLATLFREAGFDVAVNTPFSGGYDVELHGKRWYAGMGAPVVMLGLRDDQWLSGPRGSYDPDKGEPLKLRLKAVLEKFADYLLQDAVSL